MKAIIHRHGDEDREVFPLTVNACHYDEHLSWKAVGILTYLLTHPQDWRFFRADLVNRHKDGVGAVKSGLQELRKCGYLRTLRSHNEAGEFAGYVWHVSDLPLSEKEWKERLEPAVENHTAGEGAEEHRRSKTVPPSSIDTGGQKTGGRKTVPHRVLQQDSLLQEEDTGREDNQPGTHAREEASTEGSDRKVVLEVGHLCERLEVKWKLKTSIEDWVRDLRREPKYAGVDMAYEIRKCGEWHEGNRRKVKTPDRAIRNWLENAVKFAREKAEQKTREDDSKDGDPDWFDDLEAEWGMDGSAKRETNP